jgi:flavoprotein
MNESQEIYLKVYCAAIQGWLANKYSWSSAPEVGAESVATFAHKIADTLATNAIEALDDMYEEDAE